MNDEEWHRVVDEHLIRDLIEDLQARLKEMDEILRGHRGQSGLVSEYKRHDEILTRLYAIVVQDPTGKKGLFNDVDYLMGRKSSREKSAQFRWQFWTAVIVALITSATALVTNWEKIKKNLPRDHPGILEQKIERAKRPKGKKIYRGRVVAPVSENGRASEPPLVPPPAE